MAECVRTSLGYYELRHKREPRELADFYRSNYFDSRNFELRYDDDEHFHKQIPYMEAHRITGRDAGRMLDLGCGEGFSLDYFHRRGWQVLGTDYSRDGVSRHFPELRDMVREGDLEALVDSFVEASAIFDLVMLNNVLEHVLDPLRLMRRLLELLEPGGLVRVQVPNDFSRLQLAAVEGGYIPGPFWIAPREHVSYFNTEPLVAALRHCGFGRIDVLADYPIDFNLFNPDSNYVQDPSKGRNCHRERIAIENMLARSGIDNLIAFRRGCGEAGVGRNVISYAGR